MDSDEFFICDILKEPAGQLYEGLLDYGLQNCPLFLFVLRPNGRLSLQPKGLELLKSLDDYLLKVEQAEEWPGTRLIGHTAEVRWFAFNRSSARILKDVASRLYQWEQSNLPEDLCLMRSEITPWLVSIAHERDSYLNISLAEFERLKLEFSELAAICGEPRPKQSSQDR